MTTTVPLTPVPLPNLGHAFERYLLDDIVPFWMDHALDPRGGLNTCIGDDGSVISRDKFMWSQLRAIYTFSALYNYIEPRQQWLDTAAGLVQFCARHGRDEQGRWVFRVSPEGRLIEGAISIGTDSFALLGLCEYYRASGDAAALRLARDTYDSVTHRLWLPGPYPLAPYEIPPGLDAHAISMAFSLAFHELALVTKDDGIGRAALACAVKVMDRFRQPQRRALVEFVHLDGALEDSPPGRAVVPGHAIESMWFQIHQFQHHGMKDRIRQCLECLRWHMELGWDQQYGGLRLGLDLDGKEPIYWKFHDAKLWWPQTEALYALQLAHAISGEPWCLDWYWRLHRIAFTHYPVPGHGEWRQRLDRQFRPFDAVVALPVKDPFHLPRALMLMIRLLRA
ncbi:MAG: AGE family epimerase/isomerase [Phycisphaeraceae bacterium]